MMRRCVAPILRRKWPSQWMNRKNIVSKILNEAVDSVVFPSKVLHDAIASAGIKCAGKCVILNGVEAVSQMPATKRTRPTVGFIGAPGKQRWLEKGGALVETLAKLREDVDIKVFCSRRTRDEQISLFEQGNVEWLDGEFSSKTEFFTKIDALLFLSVAPENCPLVVQESLSAGVPVLALSNGGTVELIDSGKTGRLFSCDKKGEAELLASVDDTAALLKMREHIIKTRPFRTMKMCADDYENVFKTM